MSGAIALPRVPAAGPRPGRTWLDSVRSEAISFLKGDNNAPWAILAETVLGCVPILGQVIDARDVIKGLAEVGEAPQSEMAWFNLVTAVIGIVPGGGDLVKRGARGIKTGAMQMDDLLAVIRRFYKGNPEQLIKEVLDPSKIVAKLDEILTSPNLLKHVSDDARKQIDRVRADIGQHIAKLKADVDHWLTKGRKTSADTGPAAKKSTGSPDGKPDTTVKEGTRTKGEHSGEARHSTTNASTLRTEHFKALGNKVMGILGEHMADYHCQDVKGWFATAKAPHDQGQINIAKMNDDGRLVQLWPLRVRGRGIDAVWRTEKGPRPYAVVEAKASVDPTRSLNSLLGDAGDKTESDRGQAKTTTSRGGGAGRRGRGGSGDVVRQRDGKVTQMSHGWIRIRVESAIRGEEAVLKTFRKLKDRAYSRHVLFFSVPQATAHAEALIMLTAGRTPDHTFHSAHEVTREWVDNQIESVVNERAGISVSDRHKKG